MRKLITTTFITLDGVMQAPGGPEEDPTGNFQQGGWSFHYWDDVMGKTMDEFTAKPFDLLLGRKTYEIFAAHWPNSKEEPIATILNTAKKYVVSRTLAKVEWNNSVLITGNVVKEIQKLKQQNGPDIQVHGSGNLIQTLLKNKLVNELHVWIFPATVGHGKRLFGEGTLPANLKLREWKVSTTGVIIAVYEPAGDLKIGSFALEQSSDAERLRRERLVVEENLQE